MGFNIQRRGPFRSRRHVAGQRLGVCDDEPIGKVVTEEVFPVVFGGSITDGSRERRRENLHHTVPGECACDAEHHIDSNQLALPQH